MSKPTNKKEKDFLGNALDVWYYDCSCGKKIRVVINAYGSGNTGRGSCICGRVIYVN